MINKKDIRAIIFDLDGTLYKFTFSFILRIFFRHIFNINTLIGFFSARKYCAGIDFHTNEQLIAELCNRAAQYNKKKSQNVNNWYYQKFYPHFIYLLRRMKKRKRLDELFAYLKKNNILIIVFSDYNFVTERLSVLNIATDNISYVLSAEQIGALKPHPKGVQEILTSLTIPAKNILLIGDREDRDGALAKKLNINYMLVSKRNDFSRNHYTWKNICSFLMEEKQGQG